MRIQIRSVLAFQATMYTINVAEFPQPLRPIIHFVKIANEYAERDSVIYYWCLIKALEDGMKLSGSSTEAKKVLVELMNVLERLKQNNKDNDAIMQDIVAQSHIEDQAQKLFQYAESQDKAGQFNQKMVKAFYTCGYLFDVLTLFAQLDEQLQSCRKYAKWRATYIHNCLKKGEQPVPGNEMAQRDKGEQDDITGQIENELSAELNALNASIGGGQSQNPVHQQRQQIPYQPNQQQQQPQIHPNQQGFGQGAVYPSMGLGQFPVPPGDAPHHPFTAGGPRPGIQDQFRGAITGPAYGAHSQPQQPAFSQQQQPHHDVSKHVNPAPPAVSNIAAPVASQTGLTMEDYIEAKKYTKYASSALDYEDPKTAIEFMQKAISVLQKRQN